MLIAPFSHFFCGSRQLFLHKLGRALCSHTLRFAAKRSVFCTILQSVETKWYASSG